MSKTENITEEHLKKQAKELFFYKGLLDASTQEIADYAGINRTLVNYYFRSKKNLFDIVYQETIDEMMHNYAAIYTSTVPFRKKIENIIDFTIEFRSKYPYIEVFNIQETYKLNNNLQTILKPRGIGETALFLKEIEQEMEKGTIRKSDPVNFYINLISLTSFPIVMKPIFSTIFFISSKEDYQKLLDQRRDLIIAMLFNE
jgi:TetR/AcrR family transcriptional regulator